MNPPHRPSVLVEGGAGYIGAHAAQALATAGYRPVVYDNLSSGFREAVRWGPLVHGDIRSPRPTITHKFPCAVGAPYSCRRPR